MIIERKDILTVKLFANECDLQTTGVDPLWIRFPNEGELNEFRSIVECHGFTVSVHGSDTLKIEDRGGDGE